MLLEALITQLNTRHLDWKTLLGQLGGLKIMTLERKAQEGH